MYVDAALQCFWSVAYSQKTRTQLDTTKSPAEYQNDPWNALAEVFNNYEG